MPSCLICQHPIEPFISFGRMPVANGFLAPDQISQEHFFELQAGFCEHCKMAQLTELVPQEKMFHDQYAFYSSTSQKMARHFAEFAAWVRAEYLPAADPLVVEIGSNDGIMLQHFAQAGIRHLGIEPSANVAAVARGRGIQTISEFFDEWLAKRIVAEQGQADAFLGANVMCHISYLHSVAEGIRILLKPGGVLVFEDPYLGDIIEKTSYDQIYDEHAFYFSATSVGQLFNQHGLELINVLPKTVHGGSMRYVLGHQGARPVAPAVAAQMAKETAMGLHRAETYRQFRRNVEASRDQLTALLLQLKSQGQRVVGYGATSKSTTVTNYCGLTPDLVEFISDTTPIKQGKLSPGAHIPVKPYAEFVAKYPPFALLFAWNHATEIFAKEAAFKESGGQWIVYVPKVEVLK